MYFVGKETEAQLANQRLSLREAVSQTCGSSRAESEHTSVYPTATAEGETKVIRPRDVNQTEGGSGWSSCAQGSPFTVSTELSSVPRRVMNLSGCESELMEVSPFGALSLALLK